LAQQEGQNPEIEFFYSFNVAVQGPQAAVRNAAAKRSPATAGLGGSETRLAGVMGSLPYLPP
jgi:hypothetical protein